MKRPREKVYISPKPVVKHEFRNCDAPGCPNIVSVEDKPKGYSDPIYCVLHFKSGGEALMTNTQEPEPQARPFPCTECGSTKGYSRVGKYRSQCLNCNSLLKNSEIGQEDQDPQ